MRLQFPSWTPDRIAAAILVVNGFVAVVMSLSMLRLRSDFVSYSAIYWRSAVPAIAGVVAAWSLHREYPRARWIAAPVAIWLLLREVLEMVLQLRDPSGPYLNNAYQVAYFLVDIAVITACVVILVPVLRHWVLRAGVKGDAQRPGDVPRQLRARGTRIGVIGGALTASVPAFVLFWNLFIWAHTAPKGVAYGELTFVTLFTCVPIVLFGAAVGGILGWCGGLAMSVMRRQPRGALQAGEK